jgi:hypothetical protein
MGSSHRPDHLGDAASTLIGGITLARALRASRHHGSCPESESRWSEKIPEQTRHSEKYSVSSLEFFDEVENRMEEKEETRSLLRSWTVINLDFFPVWLLSLS